MVERKNGNFYTTVIRELGRQESELDAKLRRLERAGMPKNKKERLSYVNELYRLRYQIEEIRDKKTAYLFELENLRDEREDFDSAEYCERIGCCYGKCIYVNGEGEILYLEAEEDGADAVGEPAFEPTALKTLDTLPEAEKAMILNWLDEADETPLWFKRRND